MSEFRLPPLATNCIGTVFGRDGTSRSNSTFGRIADWFCGINRAAANNALERIENSPSRKERIAAMKELQLLVAEPFRKHFELDELAGVFLIHGTGYRVDLPPESCFEALEFANFERPPEDSKRNGMGSRKYGQLELSYFEQTEAAPRKFGQLRK